MNQASIDIYVTGCPDLCFKKYGYNTDIILEPLPKGH